VQYRAARRGGGGDGGAPGGAAQARAPAAPARAPRPLRAPSTTTLLARCWFACNTRSARSNISSTDIVKAHNRRAVSVAASEKYYLFSPVRASFYTYS
jgi:hypothetical protein